MTKYRYNRLSGSEENDRYMWFRRIHQMTKEKKRKECYCCSHNIQGHNRVNERRAPCVLRGVLLRQSISIYLRYTAVEMSCRGTGEDWARTSQVSLQKVMKDSEQQWIRYSPTSTPSPNESDRRHPSCTSRNLHPFLAIDLLYFLSLFLAKHNPLSSAPMWPPTKGAPFLRAA